MSFPLRLSLYGMSQLNGRTITVVGGTGSVGRDVVRLAHEPGAYVVAAARQTGALDKLAADLPGITTIAADATDEAAAARVFSPRAPDVLVLSLGTRPPIGTIGDQRRDE